MIDKAKSPISKKDSSNQNLLKYCFSLWYGDLPVTGATRDRIIQSDFNLSCSHINRRSLLDYIYLCAPITLDEWHDWFLVLALRSCEKCEKFKIYASSSIPTSNLQHWKLTQRLFWQISHANWDVELFVKVLHHHGIWINSICDSVSNWLCLEVYLNCQTKSAFLLICRYHLLLYSELCMNTSNQNQFDTCIVTLVLILFLCLDCARVLNTAQHLN